MNPLAWIGTVFCTVVSVCLWHWFIRELKGTKSDLSKIVGSPLLALIWIGSLAALAAGCAIACLLMALGWYVI